MKRVPLALLLFAVLMVMRSTAAAQACGDQRCDPEFMAECRAGGGIVVNPEDPGCYCDYATPVIVDTGDGIALTSPADGVMFDLRATGTPQRVSWTQPGSHGGFLVLDRNGNGVIDDGTELFGNDTPQPPSPNANGFVALAQFDQVENGGNADGRIDQSDTIFSQLRIWIDHNHNATAEDSDLLSLSALRVVYISLNYREALKRDRFGNTFRYRVRTAIEEARSHFFETWTYDVVLQTLESPN